MKIGFSFGQCVRDIVNGTVDIEDVFIIVSRTTVSNREGIPSVIREYSDRPKYLKGLDNEKCIAVATNLWDQGKIYQPIKHGFDLVAYTHAITDGGVWGEIVRPADYTNPMVHEAWNEFRSLSTLVK